MCGYGIGYGIGRNYRPIRVLVSVSDWNQNSGFGRSLVSIQVWGLVQRIPTYLLMVFKSFFRWSGRDTPSWRPGWAHFCLYHRNSIQKLAKMRSFLVWEWQSPHKIYGSSIGRNSQNHVVKSHLWKLWRSHQRSKSHVCIEILLNMRHLFWVKEGEISEGILIFVKKRQKKLGRKLEWLCLLFDYHIAIIRNLD